MRKKVRPPNLEYDRVIPETCEAVCKELNYKYFTLYVSINPKDIKNIVFWPFWSLLKESKRHKIGIYIHSV